MKKTVSTIGYEGAAIEHFVAALKAASINLVIDVRELPLSRKKGFSKSSITEILSSWGIGYVHLRGLGDPKEGRLAARAGDYVRFKKLFGKHMRSQTAERDLRVACDLVQKHRACLMCFEADFETCHRSIVADHVARATGLMIDHLTIQDSRMGKAAA